MQEQTPRTARETATGTATFLITITQMGNKDIEGNKITFTVNRFLSQKVSYDDIAIPVDLTAIPQNAETREVPLTGFASMDNEDMPDSFHAMLPGAPNKAFVVDGMALTGIAYVDNSLHIQTAVKDPLSNDNHGYFYLVDAAGKPGYSDASYFFTEETSEGCINYMESVFSISPEELAACTLHGSFTVSGILTEGDFSVGKSIIKKSRCR